MLDDRAAQLVADQLGHQVHLVVVDHHERPARQPSRHLDHLARNLLVDLDVAVLPRAVNAPVDHGLVGEVPEVVLHEPQHRVRDDRVVLLVLLWRGRGVVQARRGPDQGRVPCGAVLLDQGALASRSCAGHPIGPGDLGERQQGRDHAAGPAREATFRTRLMRGAVRDHDRRAVRQRTCHIAAQRSARPAPLDAVQERAVRFVHHKHHEGVGCACAWGDGEGLGDGDGEGTMEGNTLGRVEGELLGDGVCGDDDGVGDAVQAPGRNGSLVSLPQPIVMPAGFGYQSRMVGGRLLMKRFMIVSPTFSP